MLSKGAVTVEAVAAKFNWKDAPAKRMIAQTILLLGQEPVEIKRAGKTSYRMEMQQA